MSGGRLVLHVGAMKSGTTFIQSRLFLHRQALQEQGIRIPGRRRRSQTLAVQQLLRGGGPMWDKHAAAISEHSGTSVISMELLGPAPADVVRALRDSVAAGIEVVITARDLNRSIPALWQETLQNGRTWTWADYVAGVEADRPSNRRGKRPTTAPGKAFWIQQDLVRLASTWVEVMGAERVTIVTVPQPGADRELLWARFSSIVAPELAGLGGAPEPNESLGAASALVVRRMNELLDEAGVPFPQAHQLRKRLLTKSVLAGRKAQEPAIGLPVAAWLEPETRRQREGLEALGVRVVGDWADLAPATVEGIDPRDVPEHEVTEAAIAGLAGLVTALASRRDG